MDKHLFIAHSGVGHLDGGHSGRYPWGSGKDPRQSEQRQKRICEGLIDDMNTKWDYGVKVGNQRVLDTSEVDFSKWRTTPIDQLAKDKIGVCWDFVNYQHAVLKKHGIPDKNYMFVCRMSDDPDDIQTHSFTVAQIGNKQYWLESASWPNRGVHEISSVDDVISRIQSAKGKTYDLYEYNPDGMDRGLTDQEYFDRATQNLVQTSQTGEYKKII